MTQIQPLVSITTQSGINFIKKSVFKNYVRFSKIVPFKFLAEITLYFEAMAAICDSLPEARDNDPWISVNFYEYNQKVESFKG